MTQETLEQLYHKHRSADKFNRIMPESDDTAICIEVFRPITKEGYQEMFFPILSKLYETKGAIRILVYYRDYKGWEQGATAEDMDAVTKLGKVVEKIAIVNPPEKEILRKTIQSPMFSGEIKFYPENELETALSWIKA